MSEIAPTRENSSFRRAYAKGRSFASPILAIHVLKNCAHCTRVGTTISRKTGNTARRNCPRRVICEAVRQLTLELPGGYNLIFVARVKTPFAKSMDILCDMRKHLSQSGALK